ncbi:hypothetical protein HI914_04644 [Erysiphe necator]|nr:hypothetical protein HI914_04644 [Erysiphe necator]
MSNPVEKSRTSDMNPPPPPPSSKNATTFAPMSENSYYQKDTINSTAGTIILLASDTILRSTSQQFTK